MERDDAVREVQDIKRIMEESRRVRPGYPVGGVALLVLALAVAVLQPLLLPVVAIALFVGGLTFYFKSGTPGERKLAIVAIVAGGALLIVGLLFVLGLMAGSSTPEASAPTIVNQHFK